jgi:hypothetical protein
MALRPAPAGSRLADMAGSSKPPAGSKLALATNKLVGMMASSKPPAGSNKIPAVGTAMTIMKTMATLVASSRTGTVVVMTMAAPAREMTMLAVKAKVSSNRLNDVL